MTRARYYVPLVLLPAGCMVGSFQDHVSDFEQAAIVRTQPISYRLIVTGAEAEEASKHYAEMVKAVFKRQGLKAREVNSLAEGENQHLSIQVTRPTRREASAQEMLTAITLFLVPTRTTRPADYVYEITLWEHGELKATHRVVFDETTYLGLIFLPLFWVNFFTGEKLNHDFEKALETVLQKTDSRE